MRPTTLLLLAASLSFTATAAQAQTIPPRSLYETMLDANKPKGWVQFRNFNGKQLLYFSLLQTLHCRLKEIRYSINSDALDQNVELVKCNKAIPFNIGQKDILGGRVYKSMPLNTAQWVAVQVVWEDDVEPFALDEEFDYDAVKLTPNIDLEAEKRAWQAAQQKSAK